MVIGRGSRPSGRARWWLDLPQVCTRLGLHTKKDIKVRTYFLQWMGAGAHLLGCRVISEKVVS